MSHNICCSKDSLLSYVLKSLDIREVQDTLSADATLPKLFPRPSLKGFSKRKVATVNLMENVYQVYTVPILRNSVYKRHINRHVWFVLLALRFPRLGKRES